MHGCGNRLYGLHVIITDSLQNAVSSTMFEDSVVQEKDLWSEDKDKDNKDL